ncbi:MAG: biopolymer transporter ExbD [Verrucomicrobiae bacterium]|nr:biopolymer transporter ExbD [Verrucomicrobiae bacterium]
MRFRRAIVDGDESNDINVSPLIDMVFILLIFFIVTTVFVEETGTDVDKPQAASAIQLEKNSILLALTSKGQVVYGGKEIGVGGVRPLVRRLTQQETMPVIIQVDRNANAGLLVRVIDESKLGGAKNVSIAAEQGGS